MDVASLGRVLAVSPHLDDAALSAGNFLRACDEPVVLTVFAGLPDSYDDVTEWDALCGFRHGDNVVTLRRGEDTRAAALLGAGAQWLDFIDRQYRVAEPPVDEVAARVAERALEIGADTIALPFGIQHLDHRLTHDACALLLRDKPDLVAHWVAWVDVPYRLRFPAQVTERLDSLQAQGFQLTSSDFSLTAAKRAAVAEYATQAQGLGADAMLDAERPERLFLISRQ